MQTISNPELNELKTVAEQAALEAGDLLRKKWDQPRQVNSKGYRDFVTDADLASQELITRIIRAHFKNDGFLTEESDPSLPSSGRMIWIIDPVDGTSNYSRRLPTFCVSIAAAQLDEKSDSGTSITRAASGKVLAGAIYDPTRNELFSATLGNGSTLNGRSIKVSQTATLETAIIGLDWSRSPEERQLLFEAVGRFIHNVQNVRATGSASLALAWVAAGRLDAYCNMRIGPWDVAAAKLLIKEAGGRISDLHGKAWDLSDTGCIASNSLIHGEFMSMATL